MLASVDSATQFLHMVDGTDTATALVEQMPHFMAVMGTDRTSFDLQALYPTGSIVDIQETIAGLQQAGLEYLILTPLRSDPGQLDLMVRHIVEPFTESR